jgi:ribosomal protein L17
MERLKKGGFVKGPLIVECLTQGDLKQTLDEAKKAREFLEKLVSRRESS